MNQRPLSDAWRFLIVLAGGLCGNICIALLVRCGWAAHEGDPLQAGGCFFYAMLSGVAAGALLTVGFRDRRT